MKFIKPAKHHLFWVLSLMTLAGCSRLGTIPYSPEVSPEKSLNTHPHIHVSLGSLDFIFMTMDTLHLFWRGKINAEFTGKRLKGVLEEHLFL